MNKRTLLIAIGLMALFWGAAAFLVRADTQQNGGLSASRPILQETIPVTIPAPPGLDVSLVVFPEKVCPGYNLYYTFRMTNTTESDYFANISVVANIPKGTWFDKDNVDNDLGGNIPGAYQEYYDEDAEVWVRWAEWRAEALGPGQTVIARLTLHSYTSLPQNSVVTAVFEYTTTQAAGQVSVDSKVDRSVCGATVTPTPSKTPTPTSTFTPSPVPTNTPIPTNTPVPTDTPIPTEEPTEEPTPVTYGLLLPLIFNNY